MLNLPRRAGYQNYNTVAKKLDRRLTALGASVVCERGLGDDQHPTGYEAALDPWLRNLWRQLRAQYPLPQGLSEVCAYPRHGACMLFLATADGSLYVTALSATLKPTAQGSF